MNHGVKIEKYLFQTFFGELIPLYTIQEKKHTSSLPSSVPEKCDKNNFVILLQFVVFHQSRKSIEMFSGKLAPIRSRGLNPFGFRLNCAFCS